MPNDKEFINPIEIKLECLKIATEFGTETERKADIAKCLLIAERIYKHIMGENAMLNYKGV